MALFKSIYFCLIAVTLLSCKKTSNNSGTSPIDSVIVAPPVFAKGADVSWVTQMESAGYKFYDSAGTQTDCFQLLKGLGMNAIRLRVWVNPTGGWCDSADVLAKAQRAKGQGMRIMIDFHYSDSWADPGQQNKPAAWAGFTTVALTNEVYSHTYSVLSYLKANGISPEWVQVGNEVSNGMLWEDGRASTHMNAFAQMVTSGYNAVKAVDTSMKVIVHLANGYDNSLYRWMFDGLNANGAKWDIIGMSLYPNTGNRAALDSQCLVNMNDMVSRYHKQVMICEVGIRVDSPAAGQLFLADIIAKVKSVSGGNGLGVFYWEPEAYNWESYGLGAFDNTGKPTIALRAFGN